MSAGTSGSVDVAIGVAEGKVIARWREATSEIVFDPKNAYMIGIALSKAAMEAYRGSKNNSTGDDLAFIHEELAQTKVKITDMQRVALINQVSHMLKTFRHENRSDGYSAMQCVDTVLAETAR